MRSAFWRAACSSGRSGAPHRSPTAQNGHPVTSTVHRGPPHAKLDRVAGQPGIRSAPPSTAPAATSRSSRRSPNASSCVCSMTTGSEQRSICRRRAPSAGTATCPASGPGSATAFACTGRGIPRAASAAIPTSCCSIRTPRPSRARSTGRPAVFPFRIDDDGDRARGRARRDRQRAVRAAIDRRRHAIRLGRRPASPPAAASDRNLRAARQGLHGADARCPAASCAAPTPDSPIRRRSIT